ncbi:hypothetical protein [Methanosarcina mazei]|uniref:hypothetical protein n=1 Tax=Methanosarcina mazei TaxID=2209 RepID=UPI003C713058
MSTKHNNEPRDIGYSKKHSEYYQGDDTSWLKTKTIFAKKYQKDLFIFAMALGKHREISSQFDLSDKKTSNIPVSAISERQKWALLSIGIAEDSDLICLKDEKPIYDKAECYAKEGMEILKSHMDKWGTNYPKFLESELKEILGIKS